MDVYLGSIWAFGFGFNPIGYLPCDGRTLPISENEALFTLLGTTYGGDGQVTFGLPDLRGRIPIGMGQGPGLSNYHLGQMAGVESVTLTSNNLAAHNHIATAQIPVGTATDSGSPSGTYFGTSDTDTGNAYLGTSDGAHMASNTGVTQSTGSNLPFEILNPYCAINYSICVSGIYPTQ